MELMYCSKHSCIKIGLVEIDDIHKTRAVEKCDDAIAERQKTEIASQDADMRRMLQTLSELEKEIDTTPHR